MHVQNMEQLHAHNCYQNVAEPQATGYHTKATHIGTLSQWSCPHLISPQCELGEIYLHHGAGPFPT